jgi:outer membrane immunogenic protein
LKKILIIAAVVGTAGTAQFADIARKAPILKAPVAQVYDWTGFYIGVNAGVSVARDRTELRVGPTADRSNLSPFGAIGGVQAGYNWQVNKDWLLGVEADIQISGERDNETCLLSCRPFQASRFNQQIDWFGTARARIGRVDGPVLSYVTGGLAYGRYSTTLTETLSGAPGTGLPPITGVFSADENRVGFAIGSGLEASLGGNWTGKIEHLHVDLGSRTYNFGLNFLPQALSTRVRDNIFRGGVNYRFGGPGTYAPPPTANWAGLYIGANFGSVLGRNLSSFNNSFTGVGDTFHLVPEGYLGGGQIGYNLQTGAWVFGVEADFQGSFARDRDACIGNCGTPTQIPFKQTLPWLGTARGRIGYSYGSTLFFGTAGFAYGETKTSVGGPPGSGITFELTHAKGGWTAGGGIESPLRLFGLLGPNWTAKTEYLYVDLGRTTDVLAPLVSVSTRTQEHIFRGGINYHFNALTPSAR